MRAGAKFRKDDMANQGSLPETDAMLTDRQRLIVHYLSAVLIDLVVLNLFDEFSDRVHVASFSWSLLAAILLQTFLKSTHVLIQKIGVWFSTRHGSFMKFLRFFLSWLVLFLSKFLILEAIDLAFGDKVRFEGRMNGVLMLYLVITVMVIAKEAIVRFVRWVR